MSYSPETCRPPMLRRRRTGQGEPMSTAPEDQSMRRQTFSVILSVLPLSIQSRLPPMLSRPTTPSDGYADKAWNSSASSGATTPFTEADFLIDDEDRLVETMDFAAGRTDMLSRSDLGALQRPAPGSGIEWRCGLPGLKLLISAVDESKNAAVLRSGQVSSHDATFERRAYLDGVSYLLRGLPQDLDETEVSILRRALPPSVAGTQTDARGQLVYPGHPRHAYGKPSVLHKSLRAVVARAIMWCCILWPYVLFLLKSAAAFEKKHKVSEQVVAQGMALATSFGKWAVSISEAICSRGDGKVGRALADTVAWAVHDMVAGVSEGVQDGLSRAG
ncbi:hypothetical protein BR93DRAFT_82399 [Coniochaeta sp. PMI_546]|nr:hypothetical protein BR93DRAFT_82399 [Coniochaeta sp. PMI_546]